MLCSIEHLRQIEILQVEQAIVAKLAINAIVLGFGQRKHVLENPACETPNSGFKDNCISGVGCSAEGAGVRSFSIGPRESKMHCGHDILVGSP